MANPELMSVLLFTLTFLGGLLCGAWVSRWRERRAQPIWTWGLAFALIWSWAVVRLGERVWTISFSWLGFTACFVAAFVVGFLTCVIAAMTAGRGQGSKS